MTLQDSVYSLLQGADPCSDEYKALVAHLMNRIDPMKPLGSVLHSASVRLVGGVAFEAAYFRLSGVSCKIEVFLTRRPLDAPAHAGEYHIPGSFKRPGEQVKDAMWRLQTEFGGRIVGFRHVSDFEVNDDRGSITAKLFLVRLESEAVQLDESHGWYPIDRLPTPMVEHHERVLIPAALAAFRFQGY